MLVAEKKKYLQKVKRLEYARNAVVEDIAMLRANQMSAAAKIGDGMPKGSGGSNDLSGYAAKLDELIHRLQARTDLYTLVRVELECDLDAMDNPTEAAVLRRRYILGQSWDTIATEIGYEIRHVTRIHGYALQHIDLHPIF